MKTEKVKPMTNRALEQIVIHVLKKSGLHTPTEKKRNPHDTTEETKRD